MPLVKGTVVDEKNSPVSGALIAVESGTAPYPDMAIYSDEKGNFSIHLPSGHFRLGAHSPEGGYGTVECDSDADEHLFIRLEEE